MKTNGIAKGKMDNKPCMLRISRMFADPRGRTSVGRGRCGASGDGGVKAFKMIAFDYDSVNTRISGWGRRS